MRTIIAGSRSISDYDTIVDAVHKSGFNITEVVSGAARGVDRLGEKWANRYGIPVKQFHAEWERYGKKAGYLRNEKMADYANALIAVWDGQSRGTEHMIRIARAKGLKVYIFRTATNNTISSP